MASSRLRKKFCSHLCIAFLAAILAVPAVPQAEITFQREIVPLDNPLMPQWKLHWDMGRDAVRKGNLQGGAKFYEMVLREKPQIEEASWEYSQLLVQLKKYQEATTLLESLIELNPNRIDYLVLAGKAALATGEYNRAVRYLGQAYSRHPEGAEGVVILRGLIDGLKGLDRKENAFVLMEQLQQRTSGDSELLHDLARMAHELGYDDKAKEYYSTLIAEEQGNRDALDEAARVFAATGQEDKAAPLWKKLLQVDPGNDEYHRQLLSHYRKTAESSEALPHLLALVDGKDNDNPALLLEAARIYMKDQGRADRALQYYERYLELKPHDSTVMVELKTARRQIADQLFAIVENDGAELLWQDLSHFTTHRLEIFVIMAEKLEKQGKRDSLIQVLEIIYRQPGYNSEELALRLKDLYLAAERFGAAYVMYENITSAKYFTYQFYKEKGELELLLGYDIAALGTLMQAMTLRPENDDLRLGCLELAGQVGSLEAMQVLSKPLLNGRLQQGRLPLYQSYRNGLRKSGRFTDADLVADRILDESWLSDSIRNTMLLDRAKDLQIMGRMFQAERIFRTRLAEGGDNNPALFADLIEDALLSGSIEDAKALFLYYTGKKDSSDWKSRYGDDYRAFFLSYIHLLEKEGQSTAAQTELETYLAAYRKNENINSKDTSETILHLETALCRLYFMNGHKQACLNLVRHYEKSGNLPVEMRLIKYIAAGNGTVNPEALIANLPGRENHKGGITELFRLAEASRLLGKDTAAISFLQEVQRLYPHSMRARVALATLFKNTGKLELATNAFYELYQQNPQELWFYIQYLQIQFRQGHNDIVLTDLNNQPFATLPFELKLLKARVMYANNMQIESFQLYESLLQPSVRSKYRDEMARQGITITWQEQEEQSFWKMFGYDEPDWFDNLNQLKGDEGFLAQSRTPSGSVAAKLYDSYRWERLIGSEFLARKALEENKYTVAEKQYRKNTEQGQSTEGLKDLAKIYERLGEYGKQAEVYNSLEKRGENAPELQESIERNKIALAPTLGLNFEYLEKNGREGLINLQKMSTGVDFQYLPSLKSSLQFGFSELFFDPAEGDGPSVDGRLFSASGSYKFSERTTIELASGLQMLDSDSDSSFTFSARLNRKFDPLFSGYLEVNQKLIDDTVEAIDTGFTTNSIIGGLVLEGTKGITIGGEFERLWYEDNNTQNRLFLFGSYSIFDQLTTYKMKYSYEILTNRDNDTNVVDGVGGPSVEPVLPYWSPNEYWQHLFSINVHHLLNNPETAERPPSSYSFDLSVGYESERDFTIGSGADIFLEIGSNLLVKGSLFYTDSDDYEEKSATVSLMYRW